MFSWYVSEIMIILRSVYSMDVIYNFQFKLWTAGKMHLFPSPSRFLTLNRSNGLSFSLSLSLSLSLNSLTRLCIWYNSNEFFRRRVYIIFIFFYNANMQFPLNKHSRSIRYVFVSTFLNTAWGYMNYNWVKTFSMYL